MTDQYPEPKDLGSRSPASQEAQEQGMSGDKGAQAEKQHGTDKQPAQTSGRRGPEHRQEAETRKSFAPGQAPSEQGEGSPSPETIKAHQQGIGRQSGSHSAHGERTEEIAQMGPPEEEHARDGRQHVPSKGDRPRKEEGK